MRMALLPGWAAQSRMSELSLHFFSPTHFYPAVLDLGDIHGEYPQKAKGTAACRSWSPCSGQQAVPQGGLLSAFQPFKLFSFLKRSELSVLAMEKLILTTLLPNLIASVAFKNERVSNYFKLIRRHSEQRCFKQHIPTWATDSEQ